MKTRAAHTPAVAIILARKGSKGVPGKNVAMVGGRPCIAWTIDAAIQAAGIGLVAVSTDDPDAKSVARSFGAGVMVIDRPLGLAGDTARIDDAARHAINGLEQQVGRTSCPPSCPTVILYANVPIRPPGLIDAALAVLARTRADSVQSYSPVGKFHPWWTARLSAGTGRVAPWQGRVLNHGVFRRQELPPAFVPDGGVIALTRAALMLELGEPAGPHAFFGRDRRGIINPEGSVIDIDAPVDLLVADAVLRRAATR
ncbi:MAG: cytidylyltransferase domain-containing protein [Phycisphaerales bacterium]